MFKPLERPGGGTGCKSSGFGWKRTRNVLDSMGVPPASVSVVSQQDDTRLREELNYQLCKALLLFKDECFAHENGVGFVLREKLAGERHAVGRAHFVTEPGDLW